MDINADSDADLGQERSSEIQVNPTVIESPVDSVVVNDPLPRPLPSSSLHAPPSSTSSNLSNQSGLNNNDGSEGSTTTAGDTTVFQSRISNVIDFLKDTRIYAPICLQQILEDVLETLYRLVPLSPLPGDLERELEQEQPRFCSGRFPLKSSTQNNCPVCPGTVTGKSQEIEVIAPASDFKTPKSSLLKNKLRNSHPWPQNSNSNSSLEDILSHYAVSQMELPNVFNWNFDIIRLEKMSNFRPLTCIGLKIFPLFDVHKILGVSLDVLKNWLILVEVNYHYSNPYHNATHASDVLQATAYYLKSDRLKTFLDPVDKLTCLLAATVHDIDHPGKTNAFLANMRHQLALLYNDKAILESHHSAFAFKLTLSDPRVNIFQNLRNNAYRTMRASLVDMILATEMIHHHLHVNNFLNALKNFPTILDNKDADLGPFRTKENLILTKRIIIKCADVSNPARPLRITAEWTRRISEEFFRQTEEETQLGHPLTLPSFNRLTCSIPAAQKGFNDFFINNLFMPFSQFTNLPILGEHLRENYEFWKDLENLEITTMDQVDEYFAANVLGEDPIL